LRVIERSIPWTVVHSSLLLLVSSSILESKILFYFTKLVPLRETYFSKALNADWLKALVYEIIYHGYDKTYTTYI
jgi:hypothetical protein